MPQHIPAWPQPYHDNMMLLLQPMLTMHMGCYGPMEVMRTANPTVTAVEDAIQTVCLDLTADINALCTYIEAKCPAGWMVVKDTRMDDDNALTRAYMLSNPSYKDIGPACEKLSVVVDAVKLIHKDGCGHGG